MLQALNIFGVVMTFFGAFVLALSLNKVLNRVRDSLVEIEKSITALINQQPSFAVPHLGQLVKFNKAALHSSTMVNVGVWFVLIGAASQILANAC